MTKTFVFNSLLVLLPLVGETTTLSVPSAEYPTIQAGVDSALVGDTVLIADGTYTGDGNRDIEFHGRDIVLKSENGPEVTTIDCEGSVDESRRGLILGEDETSACMIIGLTVMNGDSFFDADSAGGAVIIENASPTFVDCVFDDNFAQSGGAVQLRESKSMFLACRFVDNRGKWGGAIAVEDSPGVEFQDCIFERNVALEEDSLFIDFRPTTASVHSVDLESGFGEASAPEPIPTKFLIRHVNGYRIGSAVEGSQSASSERGERGQILNMDHVLTAQHRRQGSNTHLAESSYSSALLTEDSQLKNIIRPAEAGDAVTLFYKRVGGGAIHAQRSTAGWPNDRCPIRLRWDWILI